MRHEWETNLAKIIFFLKKTFVKSYIQNFYTTLLDYYFDIILNNQREEIEFTFIGL